MAGRRQELHQLAVMSHGVVSAADLRALGIPRSTVSGWCRQDELVRLAPRVYLVPSLLDDRSPLAAVCASTPSAVASHRAAAHLWGMDGVGSDLVEITVPTAVEVTRGVVHRNGDLAPQDVCEVDGIPCTNLVRTLVDLGAVEPDHVVERALEWVLRRPDGDLDCIVARMEQLARRGRPGPAALRRVIGRRPSGAAATESELETRFVQVLRRAGLPEPVRQLQLRLPSGRNVRFDLAYPDRRLFIELDGWKVHGTREAFEGDRARQNEAVLAGWSPLRFTWTAVHRSPDQVTKEVAGALGVTPNGELRGDRTRSAYSRRKVRKGRGARRIGGRRRDESA